MAGEAGNRTSSAKTFEDLRVFQEARELANIVYGVTRGGTLARDRALAEQMRRSAISIVSNIAEGFERGTRADFARFLYIAKGSCGELRAQAMLAHDQKWLARATYDDIRGRCRKISVGIFKLIAYLKSSGAGRS